jgi:hypothetical protein
MQTLGMAPKGRESVEATEVARQSADLAVGEHMDLVSDGCLFRVEITGQAGGRFHVTAVLCQGERKAVETFLKGGKEVQPAEDAKAPPEQREQMVA